jgi:hypothetical protein
MTIASDIRAYVYCSLGEIISGSISDTYAQGAGLIRTRGEVVLYGIYACTPGATANFAWLTPTRASRIPRTLRVLSSFANPYTNQTTVQLGCLLTYLENRKPAPTENPTSQAENVNVPCDVWQKANIGISANFVLSKCLTSLGITAAAALPLTNHFSVAEFDITSGYVSIVDSLLQSEGFLGYLNEDEQLEIISLNQTSQQPGPNIVEQDIIEVGPIGVGDLPGDGVFVRYNSLRLTPPDPNASISATLKRNWESEITYGAFTEVSASYINDAGETITVNSSYYPYSATFTTYDAWDRVIESISYTASCTAEVNGKWAGDNARKGGSIAGACGALAYERNTYKVRAPLSAADSINLREVFWSGGSAGVQSALRNLYEPSNSSGTGCLLTQQPPDDYSDITQTYQVQYISELALASSLSIESYLYNDPDYGLLGPVVFDTAYTVKQGEIIVTYDKDLSSGITKTITKSWVSAGQTVTGGQELAVLCNNQPAFTGYNDFSNWTNSLVGKAGQIRSAGIETRIRTEREFGLQRRPSQADRNTTGTFKAPATEQVTEIAWVTGGSSSTSAIEFTLPYAPDDRLVWDGGSDFHIEASDAKAKALNYGRIQNALLLGNRNGISLQIPVSLMPSRPMDTLYLSAYNLTAQYRINGTSYTFDNNGIVATTDALLMGGAA